DLRFEQPIAIAEINQFLYVLDKADVSVVQVLKINHLSDGEFGVEHVGTINSISFDNPSDLGGFERSSTNILYVSDFNGLHALELNKTTGMPLAGEKVFGAGIDPNDSQKKVDLNGVFKVDADAVSGT